MSRQHTTPVLLPAGDKGAVALTPIGLNGGANAVSEADLQALIHRHPTMLPIFEIDPVFVGPVPVCTELNTPAGPIDNFLLTPSGLPVLVECKLWRNPEGRREVVGQILDYAKELSRWSSSDLVREVRRRLKCDGNPLLDAVRAIDPSIDEADFNDALTANLRCGRFLLLIIGDGIREGVEAIAEYLQVHAGLHFSFGLIELPIYVTPAGERLVVPRVLARTEVIIRSVVATPDGFIVEEQAAEAAGAEFDPDREALSNEQQRFWSEFLGMLRLDDPEQPRPRPARLGYLTFMLPAPNGSSWLTAYRNMKNNEVGVTLSSSRNSAGDYAMSAAVSDWDEIKPRLGGDARIVTMKDDREHIGESLHVASLNDSVARTQAFSWLAERVNTYINVLRPLVRSAAADYRAMREA